MAELHFEPSSLPPGPPGSWRKEMTGYHWFVLIVAALGWIFDCLDQQLFNLARMPAMQDLLRPSAGEAASPGDVAYYGGIATSVFLIGWATGGLIFGIMGDRIGRTKTMMWTILIYSVFTGLSAFSTSIWDFSFYRFLTGLGVGGEFAVGVALVAETMPERARPFALGLLQALSTVGNISAAFISMGLGHLEETGVLGQMGFLGVKVTAWRAMFVIGTLPALLAIVVRMRLKEPERWTHQVAEKGAKYKAGSLRELFGDPRWRKRAIVGMMLASAGVIGLWGIGFFSFDLSRTVFLKRFQGEAREQFGTEMDRDFVRLVINSPDELKAAEKKVNAGDLLGPKPGDKTPEILYATALELQKKGESVTPQLVLDFLDRPETKPKPQTAEQRQQRQEYLAGSPTAGATLESLETTISKRVGDVKGSLTRWAAITSLMFNVGAFFGVYIFSHVTARIGRRPTFAIAFLMAMASTAWVFLTLDSTSQVFWKIPIMGACQIAIFGGYAIYFPELFPTRLRSTGISFCYNVGRYVAAVGPPALGFLTKDVFKNYDEPMRYAGVAMCSVFLLGLLVLPFAPETKGKPLPE